MALSEDLRLHFALSTLYPLYSIDPRATWRGQLVLLLALGAAATVMVTRPNAESTALHWLKRFGVAGIMLMVLTEFGVLIAYLLYPSYLDHGEANCAAVSWLGWEGYPLYPNLHTGDVYGVAYGPAFFQVTGFFLWLLGPSVGTSKIPGLTAFALSQVLSFVTLRRAGAGVAESLIITGVQCFVRAGWTPQGAVSGVRSDALLFLASQTAVLAATSAPTLLLAGALGLLAGFCANLKIHAVFYILPAVVYCVGRSRGLAAGLRLTLVAGLAGAISLAVPFIPSNVSIIEYYHYLKQVENRQWLRWLFEQNIVFEGMLLAPLFLMYAFFKPKLPRAFYWFMGTLVSCMMLVAFAAAENGAGSNHLVPFLPAVAWGFVVIRRATSVRSTDLRTKGKYEALLLGFAFALLFGYGPIVITSWSQVFHIFANAPLVREARAEIDSAFNDNPGFKIAVGPGLASFDADRLRVIPVFRGNPLPIDSTAWMTFEADGVSDEIVKRALTECRVDLWLLPKSHPLLVISHLDGKNIFSAEVLADFHATYTKAGSGRIFDRWKCTLHHRT